MLTLFLANSAFAFDVMATESGSELHWPKMPVAYSWLKDDAPNLPNLRAAVDGAFAEWEHAPSTSIDVASAGKDGDTVVANDGVDSVFFDSHWPQDEEALALATTWTDPDGNILAFDIHINPRADWSTDDQPDHYDLQAALTHEVGHVLGIDHSSDPEATMFASQGPGEGYRRWLHEDDHAAAMHLYGDGTNPDDADSFTLDDLAAAWSCSTVPGSVGALPFLIAVAGLGRRRSIRRR